MLVTDVSSSFWHSIAPPPAPENRLEDSINVDCIVVGAGLSGLNAAWNLMKKDVSVCVLEAHTAGWGASGRNGGMAVLRYKQSWSGLVKNFGNETARMLLNLINGAVDNIEANVNELGLDGDFKRYGHFTAAFNNNDVSMLQKDIEWLQKEANYNNASVLNKQEAADLLGSNFYQGGYLDTRSAGINPLGYCREFAAALVQRGLQLYTNTAVSNIRKINNEYIVTTDHGSVKAKRIIITTNGYSGMYKMPVNLARRVVPVTSSVIATAPIPDDIFNAILPHGHLVTDTRHLVTYFRKLSGNRILFGGRGSLSGKDKPATYKRLHEQLCAVYPALTKVAVDYKWSGHVAVTLDDLPHIGSIDNNGLYAMGYGGRGVALTHLLGAALADMAVGETQNLGPMSKELKTIPFHSLRLPAMSMVATYYWLRDKLGA